MGAFSGRYEFTSQGRAGESGPCEFSFDAEAAMLSASGPPLAFDLGDIEALGIGEYELSLVLFDGSVLRLTRFARAFQTLVSELRDAHRARLVKCLLVSDLDEAARFEASIDGAGLRRPCGGRGEVRLYESNVAFLLDGGGGFQWRLADVDRIVFDERDYVVTIATTDEAVRIGKLAKRTSELVERINGRILALKERAARALHAVLPFLSAAEFQPVGAVLREGQCVSLARLRTLHPGIEPTLLGNVVDADLRPYLVDLTRRGGGAGYVGWKIIRRESPDEEPAVDGSGSRSDVPDEDGRTESTDPAGEAGGPPESALALDVGEGLEALFWFFFPIGATAGTPTHLAWEATSREGRATYVFRAPTAQPGRDALDSAARVLNRGLVALNFRRAPVYLAEEALVSDHRYRHYAIAARRLPELREVRRWYAGRAIHTSVAGWGRQLDRVLASGGAG